MTQLTEPTRPTPDLRYPIGRFRRLPASEESWRQSLAALAALPENLRSAISELGEGRLDTPYRDGGWTVRQLVHHMADSHMQSFLRMRLALTADWPMIQPYDEKSWALLPDAAQPPAASVEILDGLHRRWVAMLSALSAGQRQRGFDHPESGRWTIAEAADLYAWHSHHHVAHITALRTRMGW